MPALTPALAAGKSVIKLAIFHATVYNWAHAEAEAIQVASS